MSSKELLTREEASWASFQEAIGSVGPERRGEEGIVPGWSTHDLVWHCGFWASHAADVMERILETGSEPEAPDYAALEPKVLEDGRAASWDQAMAYVETARQRARAAFEAFDDPPAEAVTWFTDEAAEHYADHAGQITAFFA